MRGEEWQGGGGERFSSQRRRASGGRIENAYVLRVMVTMVNCAGERREGEEERGISAGDRFRRPTRREATVGATEEGSWSIDVHESGRVEEVETKGRMGVGANSRRSTRVGEMTWTFTDAQSRAFPRPLSTPELLSLFFLV